MTPDTTPDTSLTALQYAAEGGHPIAQWKLGRMYADGNGVAQTTCAPSNISAALSARMRGQPSAPQARSSPMPRGARPLLPERHPQLEGSRPIPRGRGDVLLRGVLFGNADAQYDLARLYLKAPDASRDDFTLWLRAGSGVPPEGPASGAGAARPDAVQWRAAAAAGRARPVWLTLARDSAGPDETWIKESYNKAIAKASEEDRARALQMLEHWMQGKDQ